jgi:hypothetical protein
VLVIIERIALIENRFWLNMLVISIRYNVLSISISLIASSAPFFYVVYLGNEAMIGVGVAIKLGPSAAAGTRA